MKRKKKAVNPPYQTHFHVKDGVHLREVDPSSADQSGKESCYAYIIARKEIEACDPRRLLHDFRPEIGNPLYDAGPGNVIFSVEGYDEDSRDLPQIPGFRAFVRKLQQSSICWLYFAMPCNGWLRIILASSTDDCRWVAKDGMLRIAITSVQVAKFMEHQLIDYAKIIEKRGMKWNGADDHVIESLNDSFPELLTPVGKN